MKRYLFLISLIALLLTACGSKGIYGKVTDGESNRPISGATVELSCVECSGGARVTGRTDAEGNYRFPEYSYSEGKWMLSITWNDPPACPGITPFETLTTIGDFLVTFAGYGGLGGTGAKRVIAVAELDLKYGRGYKMNLELSCP